MFLSGSKWLRDKWRCYLSATCCPEELSDWADSPAGVCLQPSLSPQEGPHVICTSYTCARPSRVYEPHQSRAPRPGASDAAGRRSLAHHKLARPTPLISAQPPSSAATATSSKSCAYAATTLSACKAATMCNTCRLHRVASGRTNHQPAFAHRAARQLCGGGDDELSGASIEQLTLMMNTCVLPCREYVCPAVNTCVLP